MRRALLALLLCVSSAPVFAEAPATPVPVERWITSTKNPSWEIYGKEDAQGVFRYSQTRLKSAAQPVLNLGVNLPKLTEPRDVRATDAGSASIVFDAVAKAASDAAADCDDGRCPPRRRPKDEVKQLDELLGKLSAEHITAVVVGLVVVVIVVLVAIVVIACLIKLALNFVKKE